jgi:hypothetical protein
MSVNRVVGESHSLRKIGLTAPQGFHRSSVRVSMMGARIQCVQNGRSALLASKRFLTRRVYRVSGSVF